MLQLAIASREAQHHKHKAPQMNIPTLSNPRKEATISDYPLGGGRRGDAIFSHESNSRGERILRTTTGKPKASVYFRSVRVVDGSDGKTYLLGDFGSHLTVMSANMKHTAFSVFPGNDGYESYVDMVKS